ncbi:MAG: hypothetical protein ABWZ79_03730, partial [Pedobacter agri]
MIGKPYILTLIIGMLLCLDVFLVMRYYSWGCTLDQIIPFALFVLLAEGITLYSIVRFNQLINPFTIYSVFIYIAGFSFLLISDRQAEYDTHYLFIISLSIISFISGGFVAMTTYTYSLRSYMRPLSKRMSLAFLLLVFVAGIGVFIMEIRQLGYLPILNLGNA